MIFNIDLRDKHLVFCHIPKCGGTTLHNQLSYLTDGKYVQIEPNSVWEDKLPNCKGSGGHQMNYQAPAFEKFPTNKIARMIILREPLQRFISYYKHTRDHPDHYAAMLHGVSDMNLYEFAIYCRDNNLYEFFNLQSKYVIGSNNNFCDLELIIDTFDSDFGIFSPMEFYNLFIKDLFRLYKKPYKEIERKNVSSNIDISEDIIKKAGNIVYECNYEDLQLYYHSLKRFINLI